MAWRVDEWVIRGEIDNRVHGRVTGRIWFTGRAEPVELRLTGDCWRDLAGRRLEFVNPQPKPGLPASFAARQEGAVGDLTASRKVKVPEVSMEELMKLYEQRKPFPWHWGNSLYLEWFSMANGRAVIESASYELKIIGDPTWEMTPGEELDQRHANGTALTGFMERIEEAVTEGNAPDDTEWHRKPQTEEEAEQMQERSDRLREQKSESGGHGTGADNDEVAAVPPEFPENMRAWEEGPFSTHRDWLARQGLTFIPPAELYGRRLKQELWRMIGALATARVFLYHTNHLSNAALYGRLWTEVLAGECPDAVRDPDSACHWDLAGFGSGDDEIWLRYYASTAERTEWQNDFPGLPMPGRSRPLFRRDHRLPIRT